MASLINKDRLARYLELNYNVLFSGRHGVGKTAVIKDVFESAGLRWKYFSASTLDPWVDFIGVPKVIDDNGKQHLELVRPSFILDDSIDAFFFDELNRAPDKVLNAIMELIQFKSINGYKLKNLKVIWAAINPEDDDDTYSVNHLDPAHVDRFHVKIEVPFDVDKSYFMKKYPSVGNTFIDWWKQIPENIRGSVSPRRLDYAVDAYLNDCRLEDFLPPEVNVKQLREMLTSLPFHDTIKNLNSAEDATRFLRDVNNVTKLLELIKAKDTLAIDFFSKYAGSVPRELVEPFIDYVQAQKAGLHLVKSLEEMIEKLPRDGTVESPNKIAALINNTDFRLLYKNGGSLDNDLIALHKQKPNILLKLANACSEVMIRMRPETLTRVFWGLGGKTANVKSNFQAIVLMISRIDPEAFKPNNNIINKKLYEAKIVDAMNFL